MITVHPCYSQLLLTIPILCTVFSRILLYTLETQTLSLHTTHCSLTVATLHTYYTHTHFARHTLTTHCKLSSHGYYSTHLLPKAHLYVREAGFSWCLSPTPQVPPSRRLVPLDQRFPLLNCFPSSTGLFPFLPPALPRPPPLALSPPSLPYHVICLLYHYPPSLRYDALRLLCLPACAVTLSFLCHITSFACCLPACSVTSSASSAYRLLLHHLRLSAVTPAFSVMTFGLAVSSPPPSVMFTNMKQPPAIFNTPPPLCISLVFSLSGVHRSCASVENASLLYLW